MAAILGRLVLQHLLVVLIRELTGSVVLDRRCHSHYDLRDLQAIQVRVQPDTKVGPRH